MKRIILLLLMLTAIMPAYSQTRPSFSQLKDMPLVTPEMYGGKGDGLTDDSAALVAALATGKNVYIPDDKTYVIKDTSLAVTHDNQSIWGKGKLRQTVDSWSALAATTTSAGSYSLLKISSKGNTICGVQLNPAFEAIVVLPTAEHTLIDSVAIDGESRTVLDGILVYGNLTKVTGCSIKDVGEFSVTPGAYVARGEGIFFSSSSFAGSDGSATNNIITGAGKNGIYVNGFNRVTISDNHIIGCGMSGVQIAFVGAIDTITISNNQIRNCAADAIDVNNNNAGLSLVPLKLTVSNNIAENVGFLYTSRVLQLTASGTYSETPDGAFLTLAKVSSVSAIGNIASKTARVSFSLTDVADVLVADNLVIKPTSHSLDDTDCVRISGNATRDITITQNRLIANGPAMRVQDTTQNVSLLRNNVSSALSACLVTPSAVRTNFRVEDNTLISASSEAIVNMTYPLKNNYISGAGAVEILSSFVQIDGNTIIGSNTPAVVANTLQQIRLTNNTIIGSSPATIGTLYLNDLSGSIIAGNRIESTSIMPAIHLNGALNLYLYNNIASGTNSLFYASPTATGDVYKAGNCLFGVAIETGATAHNVSY